MTFSESISVCLSKSFDAKGRASRPEYWWFYLFSLIAYWISAIGSMMTTGIVSTVLAWAWLVLWPAEISAGIRRTHDVGKSGWFCLIPIYNIVLLVTAGDEGSNTYGPPTEAAQISSSL